MKQTHIHTHTLQAEKMLARKKEGEMPQGIIYETLSDKEINSVAWLNRFCMIQKC